jgi:hypothetical protein
MVSVDAAMMNGTSVVGWSNPLGLQHPAHRIGSATLGMELLPRRPGALRIEVSGQNASLLPLSSFNQGAATDAEESRGLGVQVAVSDAAERLRLTGGIARSRFVNPSDPLLSGDTTVVAVRPTTRTARYGELALQLLRSLALTPSVQANLATTVRHERVDPLYRSIGASLQADVENNAVDVTGSLGALSLQASWGSARDNLERLASVLTTKSRNDAMGAALPLGALLRGNANPWYLPTLNVGTQRNHQYGVGIPTGGEFSASHVPDQQTENWNASSAWTAQRWNLVYRWNQSFQDNRQEGRQRADFRTTVQGLTLGLTSSQGATLSLDVSDETQFGIETGARQRLRRFGGTLQWQLLPTTTLSGSASHSRAVDPYAAQKTRSTELLAEVSQGFNVYRRVESQSQGRLFLRYARTRAAAIPFEPASLLTPQLTWSLNSGVSLRLY